MKRNDIASLIVMRLTEDAGHLGTQFGSPVGTRTRHFIVDALLPDDLAQQIANAFPSEPEGWFRRRSFRESKHTLTQLNVAPEILTEVTFAMQDPHVVAATAAITGIEQLEGDETLYASGLSMMRYGDFLNPHIDNSHDGKRRRYRRLNLLYYVSPGWREEWGGNLELWDDDVRIPTTIHSRFNRLVFMETARHTWHSVSPVTAEGRARCCVSNYYFSKQSPDGSDYFHATEFRGRPEQRVRRMYARVDAALRTFAGRALGLGRGRDLIYRSDEAVTRD